MTVYNVRNTFSELALKSKYNVLHESEEWMSKKNLTFLLLAALFSGFCGQLFGLGGGFIYGPMLLMIGVNPLVGASSCQYMIMCSNSVSCFMFMIFGQMNYEYMLFMSIFTATGILTGLCFIGKVVRKYNRPSFVAFALGILVVISTFVSIYSSIVSLKT